MTHRPGMHVLPRTLPRLAPLVLALAGALPAAGQLSSDAAIAIASLREDIRLLDERTRSLTVEIEQLKRDNRALRDQASAPGQQVTLAQFNTAIAELERAIRAGDKDVALQLTQQMERLAKQTQSALDTLAKSSATTRGTPPPVTFTEDYPKQGTTYTVVAGDTLAGIAARHNSSVRDIQNANKIADPSRLQVGQTLFIPQR